MKKNKPDSHSAPKMKPYGRKELAGAYYDAREVDKGAERLRNRIELENALVWHKNAYPCEIKGVDE